MGKFFVWVLAAIGGIFAGILVVGVLSTNPNFGKSDTGKKICANVPVNNRVIEGWVRQRVIRKVTTAEAHATVEVDTRRWSEISRDAKISIGVAAFCRVAGNNGRGMAVIKGSLDEDLGSVVDGNWMR